MFFSVDNIDIIIHTSFRSCQVIWYCCCTAWLQIHPHILIRNLLIWVQTSICLIGVACDSILLFAYFRILKQVCYRHHGASLSRNWTGRQLLEEDEANPDHPSRQQFRSHGPVFSAVYLLPVAQLKKSEGQGERNTDCAVCLWECEEGELLKHQPNCSYAFHIPCIDTGLESHSNCPLCRSHVCGLTMDYECSGSMYSLLETLKEGRFLSRKGRTVPNHSCRDSTDIQT